MKMKIPNIGSGNGYYGQETVVSPYMSDSGSASSLEEQPVVPQQQLLDSPALDGDFSEYMWMENEEEFEKQVMQQLEEEELMEDCLEAMEDEETEIRNIHNSTTHAPRPESADDNFDLNRHLQSLRVQDPQVANQSTLNPNAAEFVPQTGEILVGVGEMSP